MKKVTVVKVDISVIFHGEKIVKVYLENGMNEVEVVCKDISNYDFMIFYRVAGGDVVEIDFHKMVKDLQDVHFKENLKNEVPRS